MIVLIPSYEPDRRLLDLLDDLAGQTVVVVDDGSGAAFRTVFDAARARGATVLHHEVNRGKGGALRTGFAHIARTHPGAAIVCADSDGQHSPVDILRVAARLEATDADVVLGARRFTGRVPARSRMGNAVTSRLFALAARRRLVDTQTGLRAYPARLVPWLLTVRGDRFEYELRLLLRACAEGLRIEEVDIATIYLDDNASSHFRPLRDSALVYGQLLSFAASSLTGFAIDIAALAVLMSVTGHLTAAVVGARLLSASVNFALNRWWVFGRRDRIGLARSLRRYALLAGAVLLTNVALMHLLLPLTGSLVVAKVVTEVALFVASFGVQRGLVFARPARVQEDTDAPAASASRAA